MTQQLQKHAKVKREKDYEVLLQQKEQLDHIESAVKDVHEITLHVSRLVEEQGHHIDNIEAEVSETKYAVYVASEKINRTVKYKKKVKWKKCRLWFCLLLILLLLGLALTLYFVLRP